VTQVANATDVGSFISALESAHGGLQRGLRGLAADAQQVAHANVAKESQVSDLSDAMVNALVDRIQVQVSARVMRTVDETLGTIINVKA
jgi:ribosomal protein S13